MNKYLNAMPVLFSLSSGLTGYEHVLTTHREGGQMHQSLRRSIVVLNVETTSFHFLHKRKKTSVQETYMALDLIKSKKHHMTFSPHCQGGSVCLKE